MGQFESVARCATLANQNSTEFTLSNAESNVSADQLPESHMSAMASDTTSVRCARDAITAPMRRAITGAPDPAKSAPHGAPLRYARAPYTGPRAHPDTPAVSQ